MDATRPRRQRDTARQTWYARSRQWRLARHMGFPTDTRPRQAASRDSRATLLPCLQVTQG